jgi:hypothetical protein
VLTDLDRTWDLVQAGFVVVAPMTSNGVGQANAALFDDYVVRNEHTATWFFLREGDPRVAGRPVRARDADRVLVARDNPGTSAGEARGGVVPADGSPDGGAG